MPTRVDAIYRPHYLGLSLRLFWKDCIFFISLLLSARRFQVLSWFRDSCYDLKVKAMNRISEHDEHDIGVKKPDSVNHNSKVQANNGYDF